VTGYALGRTIDNPIPQVVVALDRRAAGRARAYALPLRLGALPLQVIAGVQTDLQRDDRRNFANDTGRRGRLQLDQRERVTATAGFAQLSLEAVRGLSLLGALRYDRTAFGADDELVSATDPDNSGERTMTAASPSVGVSWAFGGVGSLYANYSSAFETPTTTELVNRPTGAAGSTRRSARSARARSRWAPPGGSGAARRRRWRRTAPACATR
jgi:iron complex outermembrane receptor protein